MKIIRIELILILLLSTSLKAESLIQVLQKRFQNMNQILFYTTKEENRIVSEISNRGNAGDLVLRELYYSTYQEDIEVELYKNTILYNGLWPDLKYSDDELGTWQPIRHVDRLLLLSRAYRNSKSSYYQDKKISEVIHLGMQAWFRDAPVSKNWWYNEIGVPRAFGLVFLNMLDEMNTEEIKGAIDVMEHAGFRMTGQNKVWLAGNVLIKAIIQNDEKLAVQARDSIASEIYTTTNEGIQPDFSFHQHGAQQQFGNYGLAYVTSMAFYAALFDGTQIRFSTTQIDILRKYILDGQQWVIWKGKMDHNACGRQLVKDAQVGKALGLFVSVYQMKSIDSIYMNSYDTFLRNNISELKTNQLVGCKYFWRSDLSVCRSKDSYISVRACSPRVIGTEFTNNENKKGHFLADGNTLIYRSGKEYENIIPVWNWNKLPGVTAPYPEDPQKHINDDYHNQNAFVGGATSDNSLVSVFHLKRNKLDFKKAYFFMDNKMICLGADLQSCTEKNIVTDINQSWKVGKIVLGKGKHTHIFKDSVLTCKDLDWVWHDSIGYCILSAANVSVSASIQRGNWNETTSSLGSKPASGKVFDIWINHGNKSDLRNSYAYAILPSVTSDETQHFVEHPTLHVLVNSASIQAVEDLKNKTLGIVFYERGKLFSNGNNVICSETPGVIILQKTKTDELILSVADPSQSLPYFDITIRGKFRGDFVSSDSVDHVSKLHIPLPVKGFSGSTVTVHLFPADN